MEKKELTLKYEMWTVFMKGKEITDQLQHHKSTNYAIKSFTLREEKWFMSGNLAYLSPWLLLPVINLNIYSTFSFSLSLMEP